jgi:hypothetical protein
MTSSDDWASGWVRLSEARDWLDTIIAASAAAASDHVICLPDEHLEARAIEAFREIIGYGKVPVRAVRDDCEVSIIAVRDDGSIIPEPVEKLLAAASHTIVYPSVDQIVAYFSSCADRTIFGPRSDLFTMARDHVCFSNVEVHLPALVKPLEAIGFLAGALLDSAPAPVEPGPLEPVGSARPAIAEPAEQMRVTSRRPQRGPAPGTTGFADCDRALFPMIEQMRKDGKARSIIAAARILAREGKVASSGGTEDNLAARLARRYGHWKSAAA